MHNHRHGHWTVGTLVCVPVCSVMPDSSRPRGMEPTRLLCPWGFSRQEYWNGLPGPPPGDLPNPRIEPRSPTLQLDSLSSESPKKPKNTGVGSLSLLQGTFLTQESNWGLLQVDSEMVSNYLTSGSGVVKAEVYFLQRFTEASF